MYVFLLGFLLVIIIPLGEGVLLALLLREFHAHHPQPLGGVLVPMRWGSPPPIAAPAHEEAVDADNAQPTATIQTPAPLEPEPEPVAEEPPHSPAEAGAVSPEASPEVPVPSEVSVFDGTEKVSPNISVDEVLDSMVIAAPQGLPNDFERRIESSARSNDEMPSDIHRVKDDMDADDLAALAGALPRKKIDFTQELETGSEGAEAISPMAKEVLGENFDFDALTTTSAKFADSLAEKNSVENTRTEPLLDVQENEIGVFQVSSPFATEVSPPLADFITPQTILSTFTDDWIQETGNMVETIEGDPTNFCFTEESRPMFLRKKKSS